MHVVRSSIWWLTALFEPHISTSVKISRQSITMKLSTVGLAVASTVIGTTVAQDATTTAYSAITTLGCYSDVDPLTKDNTNTYQTDGLCQQTCVALNQPVMAIVAGSTCYCGSSIPSLSYKQVDNSTCNTPCQGFNQKMCGGLNDWTVYLTGLGYAPTESNVTSSSSSAPSATATHAAETVVVTQSAKPATSSAGSGSSGGSGPNKVGIAVGVVVGVVAIAAIAGVAIFFYKQKKRREIEEEHKAQAAVNGFVSSRGSDQKSDARLDPSMASSFRRESIGSIADERDFSRRILQVRLRLPDLNSD